MPESCRTSERGAILRPAGTLVVGIFCVLALAGAGNLWAEGTAVPDVSGPWMRTGNAFDFAPPLPGTGPSSLVNVSGNDLLPIGDVDSPILQPWAAAAVKRHNEILLAGKLAPDAPASCMPMGVPYVLQVRENVWLLQEPDTVTIIYQNDNQRRVVHLDTQHTVQLAPSWFGDSIGHYQGDTLVVDTRGIAVHEFSAIDRFGTPHTEAMHVIERYRVADDRKSLRVDFTVDDPGTFNMPWHGAVIYRRGTAYPGERPCAENNREGETGLVSMPIASKADF
jgi:hypothetical protein